MKISLNWLKEYLDIEIDPVQLEEILTAIGLEVEGMEEIESIKGGLMGVVVGQVTSCEQHPNADRLSLTKVNIGSTEELQIICGAPNVAADQKVMVATIGTTLYDKEGKDFKIKKGKIRGELSEGMICAEDELGLGEDHSGIIVLPETVAIGTLAKDYYKVEKDVIYEIGLTPNRSDATSHTGVAKDLAAALKINHEHSGKVKMPDVSSFKVDNNDLPIEVVVENNAGCPRYSGVSIEGVTIKESPDWLKKRLNAIGVRPISNIVDITNFVLHELGQPLHAFDADEIAGQKIIVKNLAQGFNFKSLDEIDRNLDAEDLMICDGDSNGMCIAGVFGGINSGVKDHTKNIFLESAHFEAKTIRRTSTRHQLRTDAAIRFEKGSDPNLTVYALKRAALLMIELGGGKIASEIVDVYPAKISKKEIDVTFKNINRLIGVDISPENVKAILSALEIDIINENNEGLTVAIPTNKADVLRDVDVIEEILRIYGFNKVPINNTIQSSMSFWEQPDKRKAQNTIADLLSASGFNEIMGVSLTQSKYYKEILPVEDSKLVYVNNTSNVHLDVMRPTMLFSGLEAVVHNQNRQRTDLKLYEFGRSYIKKEENYEEKEHLSLLLSGNRTSESWLNKDKNEISFYSLKSYVANILTRLGISGYQESNVSDEVFSYGLQFHRGKNVLVQFGALKGSILKKLDIRQNVLYADFDWGQVLKALKAHKIRFNPLIKYPSVRRDLALVIDHKVTFQDIVQIARKEGKPLLQDLNLFDVYENKEQLGEHKKSYAVSFVFRDPNKTLKDKDIDKVMNKLIASYENKLKAVIRR